MWTRTLTNETAVTEFLLLGFSLLKNTRFCLFIIISFIYFVTVMANVFIVIIVKTERSLHKPMYFLIGGLSFIEIWYPSVTVPRLIWSLKTREQSISWLGCMMQFYFHFSLGATEMFLLTAMAYDRYVAICNPLHYWSIMSTRVCFILITGSWVSGFTSILGPCLQISSLTYCGANQLDHYYCDLGPLLKVSCSDTSSVEKLFFCLTLFIIVGCFLLIILSYICIIRTTMMLPTAQGRRKAFSTFASHLMVVLLFYGPIIFMFVRPSTGGHLHLNKMVSVVPSIVTPLLNPTIYTLRNQEVINAMKKTAIKINVFHGLCL
ncbi:olfactory receptor 6B1-like [Hyla sarda]|uniref:olfactory receptor 6B1-like n=1 Tax=Hyla sarda TaxID=327740 RepID=UPI0024C3D189|nr:olfactory receptor 6B1-like [Hyla sarda]